MVSTFGIKEAKAASIFAKTKEQRLTVLAVVKMLGLPNILSGEVSKKVAKFDTSSKTITNKAGRIKKKMKALEAKVAFNVLQKYDILEVDKEWSVGK